MKIFLVRFWPHPGRNVILAQKASRELGNSTRSRLVRGGNDWVLPFMEPIFILIAMGLGVECSVQLKNALCKVSNLFMSKQYLNCNSASLRIHFHLKS